MMKTTQLPSAVSIFNLSLLFLASCATAQQNFTVEHNATSLTGTWSTGNHAVLTGPDFANPAQVTFNYPKTSGVSFSFSDDGFYEISRFRFVGNGRKPRCFTTAINWVHGRYKHTNVTGLILTPWGDGFQQIQDPCGAETNFVESYNETEKYMGWTIQDEPEGVRLRLFEFDGRPVAPMTKAADGLLMHPPELLRNTSTITTILGQS